MKNIEFFERGFWDLDRACVLLPASVDGERLRCVVYQDYLTSPLVEPANEEKAMSLFNDQRTSIESTLRQRIEAGRYADGEVLLTA